MADAAQLAERAKVLRDKLLPLPIGRALEAWVKIGEDGAPSTVGGQQPKDCAAWLQRHSLKLGSVAADGRCQYAAFSKAAFSSDEHADELRKLAVTHMRLHKSAYAESMQADLHERYDALFKLFKAEKIKSVDYDGYMEALEHGFEVGNDHTLRAMTILMQLEARVITNLDCPDSALEPRLHASSKDPRDQVGSIVGVIYLFLQDAGRYSTIEEDPQAPAQPPAAGRAPSAGSHHSEIPGSMVTDMENDVTYDDDKPIRVDGGEYDARGLLGDGCPTGMRDGTRLVMRASEDGKEWVVYKRYAQGTAAMLELRRLPRARVRGPTRRVRREAPAAPRAAHELDADPTPEDVQKLVAEFARRRLDATPMLAQKLYEVMTYYVDMLELHRNEADESPLGMLGNEVLGILDELKMLKHRLAFTVTPESQPIQQVMVGGVAGAGKSTLVNHLMHHCLKMADVQPDEPADVQVEDTLFSAGGPAPSDLGATQRDEETVRLEAQKDEDVQFRFNISDDDILPTGSGAGAMTALVTHIFLDPSARHLQLRLTYKERAKVDTVLRYANEIREHGRKLMDGEELPLLPDIPDASGKGVDVTTQAYFACALLGLENKPDSPRRRGGGDEEDESDDDDDTDCDAPEEGVEQLQRHKGVFELPERFEPLYGCERRLTLRCSNKSKLLARMQELLLVHTIGRWSHWAVLEKVELVVPSNLAAPLRVCDVPGFGDDTLDPYRQQLVTEALKQQCSTLCLALKHTRLKDDAQVAAQRLGKLGIYEDLFGFNMQRRIGKLMTVVALDWAAKEYIESKPRETVKEYLKAQHARFSSDSSKLIRSKLKKGVESRLSKEGIMQADLKERLNGVMKSMTQAFVVAVREKVVAPYMEAGSQLKWRMDDLVAALLSNNAENLKRQQEDCLEKLVGLCLVPFYSKLDQLGRLRSLKPDERLKKLNEKNLLDGVRALFDNQFGGNANKMRADQLKASVLDPKVSACTTEAVCDRYNLGAEFEHYRKRGSRKLGNDMRSLTPEMTMLPELTMRPMANEVVLPLQEKLRHMKEELIGKPADDISMLVRSILKSQLAGNIGQAPEQADALKSAMATLEQGFLESVRDIKEAIHQKYSTQISQLPDMHVGFLHDTFDQEELHLVAKKSRTNVDKRDELARKTWGSLGMAQVLSRRLHTFLRKDVLDDFKDDYLQRVQKALKYLAGMIVKAQSGEFKDLEQLNAFHVSQNCARRVAGMIHAVHKTGLVTQSFEEARLPKAELDKILEFAEQPTLSLTAGEGNLGIAELSGAVSRQASAVEVEPADPLASVTPAVVDGGAAGDEWHCPNCGVAATDTDMTQRGRYGLTRPCLLKKQLVCWCESAEDEEVCKLCVRYFKHKHARRKKSAEQSRQYKRRGSFGGADAAKRPRTDVAASQPGPPLRQMQPPAPVEV